MKKKILSLALLLVLILSITACGSNELNKIAKKINNSETVKNYKEYDYEIEAKVKNNKLIIASTVDKKTTKVEFKLDGDILSNDNISTDGLLALLLVIDGVGQTYGYKDGEFSQNINTFTDDFKKYTLDKEGLEIKIGDDKSSLKIDLSKKVPLIDIDKFYLKAEDLDMISEFITDKENGNQSGKTGNIAYDIILGDEESIIQIGQEEKLSDSAYKSIVTALEVMYGEKTAKKFQELYPKFEDGKKTVDAFTIETNYKPENKDESVFKDTKVVLVTINNTKVK